MNVDQIPLLAKGNILPRLETRLKIGHLSPLLTARPQHPYVAQKNRIQGKVRLSVEIGDHGLVTDIQVIDGPGWGLNESAIQSMRQAVFLPAIKEGDFLAHRLMNAEVEFKLGCVGCRR